MKFFLNIVFGVFILFNIIFAISVTTLDVKSNSNINTGVSKDIGTTFSIIKTINDYIWYFAIVFVFALFIYSGIILMKSEGNEEDMKKVKNIFKAMGVGIVVIILAAAIIKGVVTLK